MSSQCIESPTGAHHWMLNLSNEGVCKYCGEERAFHHPNPYEMDHVARSGKAIHRIAVKAQDVLVDPYTGGNREQA